MLRNKIMTGKHVTLWALLIWLGFALRAAFATDPLFSDDFRSTAKWDVANVLGAQADPAPHAPKWAIKAGGGLRPVQFLARVTCVALAKLDPLADCAGQCHPE